MKGCRLGWRDKEGMKKGEEGHKSVDGAVMEVQGKVLDEEKV